MSAPELIAVTGKGGVGKSTLSATIAKLKAEQGQKTLLVEFGDYSYFENIYDLKVGFHPQIISENLSLSRWDGEGCLREFIGYYIKIKAVVDLFFNNKVMKSLIKAAPALKELALLGKLTSVQRKFGPQMNYDTIVVDAFATGHFLSLLRVPSGMAEAIPLGPMGDQSRKIHEVIVRELKVFDVTLAEEMPLQESIELAKQLEQEFSLRPQFICNQWLETELTQQNCEQVSVELPQAKAFASSLKDKLAIQNKVKQQLSEYDWVPAPWLDELKSKMRIQKLTEDKKLKGFIQ